MPWVCQMCSSNNGDDTDICFVCDSNRTSKKICTLTLNKVEKLKLSGDVVVPEEFNVIGEGAFKGRADIYSVTLHGGVRKIAKEAFSGCKNLKKIIYTDEIATVGIRAFADCTSLPKSARVKAKYVADDAYYITSPPAKPSKTEPPKKTEEVKIEEKPKEYYKHVPKDIHIPDSKPKHVSAPEVSAPSDLLGWLNKYKEYIVDHKTHSTIVLICGIVLTPLIYLFVRASRDNGKYLYLTCLGLFAALICFASVYAMILIYQNKSRRLFTRDILIAPIAVVIVLIYTLMIIFGKSAYLLNQFLMLFVLGPQMYLYFEITEKEEYEVFPILVVSIIESILLEATLFFSWY